MRQFLKTQKSQQYLVWTYFEVIIVWFYILHFKATSMTIVWFTNNFLTSKQIQSVTIKLPARRHEAVYNFQVYLN